MGEPMRVYNFVLDAPAPPGTYLTPLPLRQVFRFGTNLLMHC
jgi:hypothetical protein